MQTITFMAEKGGVGKTTLSINIASELARRGYRVVLVDTDKQAHATIGLGLPKSGALYNLLVKGNGWGELLQSPLPENWAGHTEPAGSLWVLPSNSETVAIPLVVTDLDVLQEPITDLEGIADFVIIDTPPTGGMLQSAIFYASDAILIPTELEYLSMDGLAETAARLKKDMDRRANTDRPVRFLGVQPTKYDARRSSHKHGLDLIKEHFGERYVHPKLTNLAAWADASYSQQSIFAYVQDDQATGARRAAAEMSKLVNYIEKELAPIHG